MEPITLERVLYTKLTNEVSCLVDNRIIVLAEHQSTINENMPLRCLEYLLRLYEKLQAPCVKYYKNLQPIPTPEFYVFYNGKAEYPEEKALRLSDAFMVKGEHKASELIVEVININADKAHAVVEKCKLLKDYSLFVQSVPAP